MRITAALVVTFFLMGFTSYFGTSIATFYQEYKVNMPRGNAAEFCLRDICEEKRRYTYTASDLRALRGFMASSWAKGAKAERAAIGRSVAWLTRKLGKLPTDCVAKTFNVTSHLLVMQRNGLLKFHTVIRPAGKWSFSRWPHWASRIKARNGQIWSVDSYFVPAGARPQIIRFKNWYLPS